MPSTIYFTHISSPVGTLMIAASNEGLRAVEFPQSQHPVPRHGAWQALDPGTLKSFSEHAGTPTVPSCPHVNDTLSTPAATQAGTLPPGSSAPQSPCSTGGTAALQKPDGTDRQRTDRQRPSETDMQPPSAHIISLLISAKQQLDEYFAGHRQHFELPLAPQGTPFQLQVWQALRAIPYGETWSYAQLAQHIGNPRSVRAVGAANGKNPIAIIIPCHRVIGANGSLVGFGGGLSTKEKLLSLESAQQPLPLSDPRGMC